MAERGIWLRRAVIAHVAMFTVGGLGVVPATAQVPPPQDLPRGVEPTPQQVTPPTPDASGPATVRVDSRAALEQRPCPFDGSALRLNVTGVTFTRPDGAPLAPEIAATLAGVSPATGDQPVRVVCDIRDAANEALRRDGWVASVQVPPQEITGGGALRLNVVTAHIVETRVRGTAGPYEALLRARIAELEALDPLNERDAERILLLAGDIPGLDVQLALRPAGTAQGDVIGELTIAYRRFAITANVQNYNSRRLGRETGYVRAELYGLTGMGDITYVGASSTADFKEQRIAQIGHIATLDGAGTTLGARFSYAWSRPDLEGIDFRTDTLIAGVDLVRPLIRSVGANLGVAAGFDYVDQTSTIGAGNTVVPLTADKLRIGYVSLAGDVRRLRDDGSLRWSWRGEIEVRKGYDIFGASDAGGNGGRPQSRFDGNSRAWVIRGDADAVIGIGRYFALAGQMQAQWANDPLLNYEEFSLGNLTIGRGYDPGANSGDRAIGLRGEVQANVPITPRLNTQVFGFYDYVHLDNLDIGSTERKRNFNSYGGGVRVALPGELLLEVVYAHPKNRALTIDPKPPGDRILVSLSYRFRDRLR